MHPATLFNRCFPLGVLSLFILCLPSCSHQSAKIKSLKFIVVRHADKQTLGNSGTSVDRNDPEINEQGKTRARPGASAPPPSREG
jgi:hypothetical protein